MSRFLFVVVGVVIGGAIGFIAGGQYFSYGLVTEINGMAAENFATALSLFKGGYQSKRLSVFGESEEHSSFVIDDYEFVVIPGSKTTSGQTRESSDIGMGNMAAHTNAMAVMLACKWIEDGDPRGHQLLDKLRQIIPNFKLSSPYIETVAVIDLEVGSEMMKQESDQWDWRMGK